MTTLDRALQALAIRPMLWCKLTELQAHVMRGRIHGQAYTAIGQTAGGKPLAGALVKKTEEFTVKEILKHEEIAIKLDRGGYGSRWAIKGKA